MTFTPAVPLGGLAGYRFLETTQTAQRASFDQSPSLQRQIAYFSENIKNVETPADLVADRQLLEVSMVAFGLGDDLYKKAFIEKVLEEGTIDSGSLANRLVDRRYTEFAEAFGFDNPLVDNTKLDTFRDNIIGKFLDQNYEIAVGEQDPSLRLALYFKREGADISEAGGDTGWFALMGDTASRTVLTTALNIPTEVASLDIDTQLELFQDRAKSVLGIDDPAQLSDPEVMDKLISRYLIIDEATNGSSAGSAGSTALTLLQAANSFGASAYQNYFQSF